MLPFERELSVRDGDEGRSHPVVRRLVDPGAIETVAALCGLLGEGLEVRADGGERSALLAEALQLGVGPIALSAPGEHGLGQQGLPPAAREALAIEVAGVQ